MTLFYYLCVFFAGSLLKLFDFITLFVVIERDWWISWSWTPSRAYPTTVFKLTVIISDIGRLH